jgi:predicted dehydrogenase
VLSHVPYRTFRLVGSGGVIEWDWSAGHVRVFTKADGKWQIIPDGHGFRGYSSEHTYLMEIEQFVKAVRGDEPWVYTLAEDARVLAIVSAADLSSEQGRQVALAAVPQ